MWKLRKLHQNFVTLFYIDIFRKMWKKRSILNKGRNVWKKLTVLTVLAFRKCDTNTVPEFFQKFEIYWLKSVVRFRGRLRLLNLYIMERSSRTDTWLGGKLAIIFEFFAGLLTLLLLAESKGLILYFLLCLWYLFQWSLLLLFFEHFWLDRIVLK